MEPVTGEKLIDLIPQKPPFVFISALNSVTGEGCATSYIVDGNSVLCDNKRFSAAGLIENIAQTCAAKAGYECYLENKPIPVGFIGDLKNFSYDYLPAAGEEIFTEIVIENKVFNVTIIAGKVMHNGREIARARMKIYSELV